MNEALLQGLLEWGVLFAVAVVASLLLLGLAKRQAARFSGKGGKPYGELLEEQIAEMRRFNDHLERTGRSVEQRLQRIEERMAMLERGAGTALGQTDARS